MKFKLLTAIVALGAFAAACSDRTPTGNPNDQQAIRASNTRLANERKALLTNIPIANGAFSGSFSVTHIGYDQATNQLLFSGTVTRTSDGVTEAFTNVPGTLSNTELSFAPIRTPVLGTNFAMVSMLSSMMGGTTANVQGSCSILLLGLQPIHLDLLGLVLDLSAVTLDLHADPGAGNLLGNLLCAVTHLLDGPAALSAITSTLDRINAILAGV